MAPHRFTVLGSIGAGPVAVGALVLLAATGCGGEDSTMVAVPAAVTSSDAGTPAPSETTAGPSTTAVAKKPGATTVAKKPGATSTGKPKIVTCTNSTMKLTVTPVSEPVNHLLITATNTGPNSCYAYSAPTLSFDLRKDLTIEVNEDSTPQPVVWVAPGESTYAGVLMSSADAAAEPEDDNHYTATRMTLWFADGKSDGNAGPGRSVTLAGEGIYLDETVAQVTYWQSEMDTALLW